MYAGWPSMYMWSQNSEAAKSRRGACSGSRISGCWSRPQKLAKAKNSTSMAWYVQATGVLTASLLRMPPLLAGMSLFDFERTFFTLVALIFLAASARREPRKVVAVLIGNLSEVREVSWRLPSLAADKPLEIGWRLACRVPVSALELEL